MAEKDVHGDDFASLASVGALLGDAFAACASEFLRAFFLCAFSHGGMPFEGVGTGESIAEERSREQAFVLVRYDGDTWIARQRIVARIVVESDT